MKNNTLYSTCNQQLLDFIRKSPSPFHVTANFAAMLEQDGFFRLREQDAWKLEPGKCYYVTRSGSSLIAFRIPERKPVNFQIAAAHSDSPVFRVKTNPYLKSSDRYVRLNVEKYGGSILSSWLDRPLSLGGRVMIRTKEEQIRQCLVHLDRDLVLIPNLAIHMNRSVNDGYSYQVQTDLLPLFGDETSEGKLEEQIAQELGIEKEQILSADLFLYNRTPGSIWGANMEYISSPKLDDLQCAFSIIQAVRKEGNEESICMAAVFDNEEVGSLTAQGADSTFLQDTILRIWMCAASSVYAASSGSSSEESLRIALSKSFLISADNAHALHPQHTEKADPVHRPSMNRGPVIKFSANQKYTTDAFSCAVFQEICKRSDVPYQVFHNHSDQPGGSTLGNISNAHVSLHAVDIGLAQLAMHSSYETAGALDTGYLIRALETFYRTVIRVDDDRVVF